MPGGLQLSLQAPGQIRCHVTGHGEQAVPLSPGDAAAEGGKGRLATEPGRQWHTEAAAPCKAPAT